MPVRDISAIRLRVDARRITTYPPGATYGPRTLHDHEFVWMLEGTGTWTCDGRDVEAGPGSVLLARPGMSDAFRWDDTRRTRHAYFHFALDHPADLPPPSTWPLVRRLQDGDVIPALFSHLLWLSEARPEGAESLVEHAAAHILVAFVTGASGTAVDQAFGLSPPLERCVLYVRERWRRGVLDAVGLDELAASAAVSSGHLSRLFRAEIGHGPVESLRLLRLERAAVMLVRTNLAVQEVARVTGFPNQFHFSRRFRQTYGRSPREFRSDGDAVTAPGRPGLAKLSARLLEGVPRVR